MEWAAAANAKQNETNEKSESAEKKGNKRKWENERKNLVSDVDD